MKKVLFFCAFLLVSIASVAQLQATGDQDTIVVQEAKPHSPKKATILSACIPGAGQIYNKKYWKLPLVYGGIGTSVYLGIFYTDEYKDARDEYRLKVDNDPNTVSKYDHLSEAAIRDLRDTYRRWMELSYISAGLIYILQIVDANVDAHLMEFDVSDDLALRVQPQTIQLHAAQPPALGLGLALKIK